MITGSAIARGTSIPGAIIEEFVRLVAEGGIRPGDRLPPESELASTWKVGRSSIREAFGALQLLGVVEATPGRGTILSNTAPLFALIDWSRFSRAEAISDIVEARLELEPAIAHLAAERAGEEDLLRIEETIIRGRASIGDTDASIQASLDFHGAVATATGNQTLRLMTRLLRSLYYESTRLSRRDPESYRKLLRDHEAIYEAIRAHAPDRAAMAVEDHLRQGVGLVTKTLAEDGEGSSIPDG
ncbi:MAG: FadR/GntR family transcriptional regulator [Actinomycetota bacterium]|nr:FadR/GntR family transcriptional regulator [Actinomycetota bacterium]